MIKLKVVWLDGWKTTVDHLLDYYLLINETNHSASLMDYSLNIDVDYPTNGLFGYIKLLINQ